MSKYRVVKSRKAETDNPLNLQMGERVLCIEESNEEGDWPGWILCKSESNEGWVPRQIVYRIGDVGTLLEDYNAREFDIEVGEVVIMDKKLNGWIWGEKEEAVGEKAWAPLNHLEEIMGTK